MNGAKFSNAMVRDFFVRHFQGLGSYKRIIKAFVDTILPAKSYSQHGEDIYVWTFLSGLGLLSGVYVDVGANHPTSISNTYLFYRKGYRGIIIEPNVELARLHPFFRKNEKTLQIGIGDKRGIFEFNITKTPVLSSFRQVDKALFWKNQYVPVLTLDDVIDSLNPDRIFF